MSARVSSGRDQLGVGDGQRVRQLPAGADRELGEHLAQVPLHGARAEEQPRADLGIRRPVASEPSELKRDPATARHRRRRAAHASRPPRRTSSAPPNRQGTDPGANRRSSRTRSPAPGAADLEADPADRGLERTADAGSRRPAPSRTPRPPPARRSRPAPTRSGTAATPSFRCPPRHGRPGRRSLSTGRSRAAGRAPRARESGPGKESRPTIGPLTRVPRSPVARRDAFPRARPNLLHLRRFAG